MFTTRSNRLTPGKLTLLSDRRWWLAGPLLAGISLLPALEAYFTGEDFVFIQFAASGQPFYHPTQNLFYRPLPNLLWQFDYSLWGLEAAGYHLTNLLLHLLNIALVGLVAQAVTARRAAGSIAALLFAVHPIHVEPVVWLAGRPDLLATLFFLVALLSGLKFFSGSGWPWYLLSWLAFLAALFSKESAFGLPVVLCGCVFLLKRPVSLPQSLRLLLTFTPYLLTIGFYLAVRFITVGRITGYEAQSRDLLYIFWNATLGMWLPLLFPINFKSAGWLLGLSLVAALALVYGWLIRRVILRPKSFQNLRLTVGYSLVFMYGSILPALNLSPVTPDLSQSRLLYLPSVGFCLLFAMLLSGLGYSESLNRYSLFLSSHLTLTPFQHTALSDKVLKGWRKLVAGLLIIYLAGTLLALLPWWQAGRLVKQTFPLLQGQNLPLAAGDIIYYEGLPDSFNGVYVWRNGLDEATRLVTGQQIAGLRRTEDLIVDYRKAQPGRMWFVRYYQAQPDAPLTHLFTYRVSSRLASQVSPQPAEVKQVWNFSECDRGGWNWSGDQSKLKCFKGRGLLSNHQGQKTSLVLKSPFLNLPSAGFQVELNAYLDYDFHQPVVLGQVSLSDSQGKDFFSQSFDLAADGKNHSYSLLIPTQANFSGLAQLRFEVYRVRTNILWQTITLAGVN